VDIRVQQPRTPKAAIAELKCIKWNELGHTDKRKGMLCEIAAQYGLEQIARKGYRFTFESHVTELREMSIAFLGPSCAITGRRLERPVGRQWKVVEESPQ